MTLNVVDLESTSQWFPELWFLFLIIFGIVMGIYYIVHLISKKGSQTAEVKKSG